MVVSHPDPHEGGSVPEECDDESSPRPSIEGSLVSLESGEATSSDCSC